jgi:M6 family metalloprotease-like protein
MVRVSVTRAMFIGSAAFLAAVAIAAVTAVAPRSATGADGSSLLTGACAPPFLGMGTGEGQNSSLFPSTVGDFRIAMLFVEFADARGVTDPSAIYDRFIPRVAEWYRGVSYGRLRLFVTPVRRWLSLPGRAADYGATQDREAGMRVALEQAVAAVDAEFDFRGYDALYLVLPTQALGKIGQVGVLILEQPIEADGQPIRALAWLFADETQAQAKDFDAYVVHETGHLLGLPDLYVTGSPATFHLWDTMAWGSGSRAGGMFAWHRWKLGWLDESQVACLNGRRSITAVVTPLERPGGTKAIIFRGTETAYVVEVRQRLAEDAAICRTGVLIYRVLFDAPFGSADVYLLRARSEPLDLATCGWDAAAPFTVRRGRVTRLRVGDLRFEILRAMAEGSYRIRVTRR